jgi:lipopolysaccharide export system permease protein
LKILDRYILNSFFKNYLISFMVLVGLYIALDMVFSFGDMTESSGTPANLTVFRLLYDIGDYYFYQTFVFFVQLSGMITVVAAAFTLMRMSRFNELTALLASGVPLQRVSMWIIVAGVFLNVVLVPIDQELVIPQMIPKLIRKHEDMHSPTPRSYPISEMQDDKGGVLMVARYTPPGEDSPAHMDVVDIIMTDGHGLPTGKISADAADWDGKAGEWKLTNGIYTKVLQPNDSQFTPPAVASEYKSDITPDEIGIWRGGEFVELLPFRRLTEMLYDTSRERNYGENQLLRAWNMRLTQPFVNVILLLLAIPAVLTREPGRLKFAAARCLTYTGTCMGLVFMTYQLSASPPGSGWFGDPQHWPAIMSGLPVVLFGPLAVWLMERVKT